MRGALCVLVLLAGLAALSPYAAAEEPAVADDARPATPPGWRPELSPPPRVVHVPRDLSLATPRRPSRAPGEPIVPTALERQAVRIGDPMAKQAWYGRGFDPDAVARGPAEIRDDYLLAQPRLTLPAMSPDGLGRGRWRLGVRQLWGNDFAFKQTGPAESPLADRRYMVDGEHLTYELEARTGLGRCVDVGVRVPLQWRGGGFLDGLIEWWHKRWGMENNAREEFRQDVYRVLGRDDAFQRYDWEDQGWGLGNVELNARWQFLKPARRSGWRAAAVGRIGLPSGTGPYETGSVDVGLQVLAAKQLGRRFDVYGGLGGTWYSEDQIDGIVYEPVRGHGFLALEWRPLPYCSVLVQTDASSRLVTNLADYPEMQWYVYAGFKFDLGGGFGLSTGIIENLFDQQSTTDFAWWWSFEYGF